MGSPADAAYEAAWRQRDSPCCRYERSSGKLGLKRSRRDIARSLAISASSVGKVAIDAAALGLDLAAVEELSDSELETKLYPKTAPSCMRPQPDCAALHLELRLLAIELTPHAARERHG